MRTIRENRGDERRGLRPDGPRPVDEARGRPLQMVLVGLGHVSGDGGVTAAERASRMGGHPLTAVEDLDGGGGQAGVLRRSPESDHLRLAGVTQGRNR